jgi:DNA-binding NarL/FixJ family response regulator
MVERSARGRPPHPDILTPAEWRIAHAVRHGMTTRAIARRQGVSVDAVKFHLDNIRRKLGLQTRAQAAEGSHPRGMNDPKLDGTRNRRGGARWRTSG